MEVHKKYKLFVTVYKRSRLVKPAQPAEQKHLTPMLLMRALQAILAEPAIDYIFQFRVFSAFL